MDRCARPLLMRLWLILAGTAVLNNPIVAQSTSSSPNFQLAFHPRLSRNVLPGDFNADGRTDLVAATPGNVLVVRLGRGDGGFRAAVGVGLAAVPLAIADLNGDGFQDVVILANTSIEVLPGNGNGTFDSPVPVAVSNQTGELRTWALAADFDGDLHTDVVVPGAADTGESILKLYPGRGDFTFDVPLDLPGPEGDAQAVDGVAGDFNGDGLLDLATASLCCRLGVYINNGARTFTPSAFGGNFNFTDIATGDFNGDGRLDLVASEASSVFFFSNLNDGQVFLLLGHGDGTFGERIGFDTNVGGEASVVAGDFNGDGNLDVATGNQSVVSDERFGRQLWDSVSIMPGDGTGRLLAATTYALGTVNAADTLDEDDPEYPYTDGQHQLQKADVNGDGRIDLIASPGVVLRNRAPVPNRRPRVFAGADRAEFFGDSSEFDLRGEATDPDRHWLIYTWRNESGQVIGRLPWIRHRHEPGTAQTYTLTVDDGHGGRASDSVTIRIPRPEEDPTIAFLAPAFGESIEAGTPYTITWTTTGTGLTSFAVSYSVDDGRTFTLITGCESLAGEIRQCVWSNPSPVSSRARLRVTAAGAEGDWIAIASRFRISSDPPLPPGWASGDIGNVGIAGSASFADGTWIVEGSGADIWGSADEFRYVYRRARDFTFTARVTNIENLAQWVKAGIMVREDLTPGSRHVSLFATPGAEPGVAFQRRILPNGNSTHISGPAVAPPVWLRVGRVGAVVSAYVRTSPMQTWTLVSRATMPGAGFVYVGLAVTSHVDGELATTAFDNVSLEPHPITDTLDIGSVGMSGTSRFDGVVFELDGSGADIWGTSDAFRFAYSRFYSPGSISQITARVRSVENTDPWAKAGVMFRDRLEADSRHVMVIVSPGRGVAMQYRAVAGGPSAQVRGRSATAPEWVRLSRNGHTFTGYASEDGVTWEALGSVTIDMFAEGAGLAVTSHDNSELATASFEDIAFDTFR